MPTSRSSSAATPCACSAASGASRYRRRRRRRSRATAAVAPMQDREIVERAFAVFRADAEVPPPLTLRGGDAADGYDVPEPFDPALDEPTDAYIEMFAYHALPFLDARSWRHYLPRLIDFVLRHPDDERMVAEGLIYSL